MTGMGTCWPLRSSTQGELTVQAAKCPGERDGAEVLSEEPGAVTYLVRDLLQAVIPD